MITQAIDIGSLITSSPNIRGGRPRIAGTGVTVQRIVGWYGLGRSPEEIVDTFGHITIAQVYAALAYYHANRQIMDTQIAADQAEEERLMRERRETRHKEKTAALEPAVTP